MSTFKRAWLYITRKKVKSIIMFFILLGIATATLGALSIKKATLANKQQINKNFENGFQIDSENKDNDITSNEINQILGINGVSKYNAKSIVKADAKSLKQVEPLESQVQLTSDSMKNAVELEGIYSSELDNMFVNGLIKLVEGRHISKEDESKVLIHKRLAELNGLKLGDTISVGKSKIDDENSGESDKKVELTIIGIFDSEIKQEANMSSELVDNLLIGSMNIVKELYDYTDETIGYRQVNFYVNDVEELDSIIDKARALKLDWSTFKISGGGKKLDSVNDSVNSLDSVVSLILMGAIAIGFIILSLILAFWIQERIHETGILLSVGIEKRKIIYQYIIELLMIAVVAFGISYFSGGVVGKTIGTNLVREISEQSTNSGVSNFESQDMETRLMEEKIKNIDVSVSFREVIYVWVMGSATIVVSVIVASTPIIRLKPKEILSKMS